MKYLGEDRALLRAESHPSRVCGLKFSDERRERPRSYVTPLAGVWIEISSAGHDDLPLFVTPLAGVWIEMAFG